jgi:hypothetical protein
MWHARANGADAARHDESAAAERKERIHEAARAN